MDYTAMAKRALDKITKYGTIMVLTKKAAAPTMDPDTGEFTSPADTDYMVAGVEQSFGDSIKWMPETEVKSGDRMFLLAASGLSVIPMPGDILTKANDVMSIVSTAIISPGDADLLYRVLARP